MKTQYILSYQTRDGVWHNCYEADDAKEVRLFYRFNRDLRASFANWKLERKDITELPLELGESVVNPVTGEVLGYVRGVSNDEG